MFQLQSLLNKKQRQYACLSFILLVSGFNAGSQIPGKPYSKSNIKVSPSGVISAPQPVRSVQSIHGPMLIKPVQNVQGKPFYILPATALMLTDMPEPSQLVESAITEVKEELAITNVQESYEITQVQTDDLGIRHIRFNQMFNGVEVWGGSMILHVKPGFCMMNGSFLKMTEINMASSLTSASALVSATGYLRSLGKLKSLSPADLALIGYSGPEVKQVIYNVNGNASLCWFVRMKPDLLSTWHIFIEANTGKIVKGYEQSCTIDGPKSATSTDLNSVSRTINTYEKSGNTYLLDATRSMFNSSKSTLPDEPVGAIWTIDANNTYLNSIQQITSPGNNSWPAKGVSAHYNAGVAFDYYKNVHSRNSINGSGGNIISVINVSDENGQGLDNAFWTGEVMCYGNGKVAFKPLAGGLDVAGHEMTHGVVQNTANLEYNGQSGAINESMADIFGCMMDRDDWKMGEDVVKTLYFPTGALRDIQDPHNGGSSLNDNGYQPRIMSEYYSGSDDNGGVHINSGIPNWAFYKFASVVGKDKAEKVYYRALSTYLTKTSQFVDLRISVVQSCIDLYGDNSAEYNAAKDAFNQVGIYATDPGGGGGGTGGGGTSTAVDLPVNPGQDYLLSYDASLVDPVSLYKSSTAGTNFVAMSSRPMNRRPSVTDDGSFCVFVGTDHKIYKLTLGSNPSESVVSSEAIWDNAVVSKDGKRIAAITTSVDSAIYVYDFTQQKWQEFRLYNPTYTAGVNPGSVLYADAMEFDYTGEKIVYDARNQIPNASGTDLDFWDIGMIEVWNSARGTFGSGKIEKLYTQLPADVSIGNPAFAKNSPYIIAFDYIDLVTPAYAIIGKNTITNQDDIIVLNDQVSYPSYSKLDDKILYDVTTSQNQKWLAVVSLDATKIKGNNDAATLVPDAYWGAWYSTGTRALRSAAKDITVFTFPALNPPVKGTISGNVISLDIPFTTTTDFSKLIATFSVSAFATVKVDTTTQISGVTANNFTTSASNPVNYVVTAQDGSVKTYQVKVNSVNGINEVNALPVSIFPNPSAGQVTVSMRGRFEYRLVDLQGRLLAEGKATDECTLNGTDLLQGVYILQVSGADFNKEFKVQISR